MTALPLYSRDPSFIASVIRGRIMRRPTIHDTLGHIDVSDIRPLADGVCFIVTDPETGHDYDVIVKPRGMR